MLAFILTLFHNGFKQRSSTLYHLLLGKRTASVLMHGFFYDNLRFSGSLPRLQEREYQGYLNTLVAKGRLQESEGIYQLTATGKEELVQRALPGAYAVDYFRYGRKGESMWQLLLFGVQAVSEWSFGNSRYLPIATQPYQLQQTKRWLKQATPVQLQQLPQEISGVFQRLPQETADFLAQQFSGHSRAGSVFQQLLPERCDPVTATLCQDGAVHHFFQQLPQHTWLYQLIEPLDQQNLNRSMLKTRQLVLQGAAMEDLLRLRKVKESTINDHLIEWAILDEAFPFAAFLPDKKISGDFAAIRLWRYQDYLDWSFLQFRLTQIAYLKGVVSSC